MSSFILRYLLFPLQSLHDFNFAQTSKNQQTVNLVLFCCFSFFNAFFFQRRMNCLSHVIFLFNIPRTLFTKVLLNLETTSIQGGQWCQWTYLVYLETHIYFDKKWIQWEIRETSEFKVCFRLAHVSLMNFVNYKKQEYSSEGFNMPIR